MSETDQPNNPEDHLGDHQSNPEDPFNSEWIALGRLANSVRQALATLEEHKRATEQSTEATLHKMRWLRRIGVIGVIAGVLGVVVGSIGLYEVDKIYDQRRQSRIITCGHENENADRINALNDRTQGLLRNVAAGNGTRTPEQQAATDRFINAELAEYEKVKVPKRDCSPAAVEDFYRKNNE